MGDREETDGQNQQRQNDAGEPLAPAVAAPAPNPNQPHGEDVHDGSGQNPQKPMNWFRNPDWWMVILTAFLFVVGVVTLIVFYRQFGEMQKQTTILNTQAQQAATDSIEAAKKVERQLTISDKQAKSARDQVEVISKQMRLEQRAWIGVGVLDLKGLVYKNFGKGTALKVTTQAFTHFSKTEVTISDKWIAEQKDIPPAHVLSAGSLFPDQVILGPTGKDLTKYIRWSQVEAGTEFLYEFGTITYFDVFGQRHSTKWCGFWVASLRAFDLGYGCYKYNTAS